MSNEAGQTMRIIINLSVYFSSKATEEDTLFVCFCFVCFVSELETNQANKLIIAWPGFISQHESDEMIEAKKHRVRGEEEEEEVIPKKKKNSKENHNNNNNNKTKSNKTHTEKIQENNNNTRVDGHCGRV